MAQRPCIGRRGPVYKAAAITTLLNSGADIEARDRWGPNATASGGGGGLVFYRRNHCPAGRWRGHQSAGREWPNAPA